jgi:hypothetical protein
LRLGPIVLKLRLQEITAFESRVAGAAELELARRGTLNVEQAFVVQLSESVTPNTYDSGMNQVITETCAVIVALRNDSSMSDRTGLTAYDRLADIRADVFKALLGWEMPGAETKMEYAGGRLLDIDRGWMWYQFEFSVTTRIDDDDGVDPGTSELPLFEEIYAQYILADSQKSENLPGIVGGQTPRLPADSDQVDAEQDIKEP